jgi:hypothetical protein
VEMTLAPARRGGAHIDQVDSGAPPRMTTVPSETPTSGAPAEGLVEPRAPLTQAGRPRQRLKWTDELNAQLLRAYFRVTRLESEKEGHRTRLHEEWLRLYPESTRTEQNLCSQLRSITIGGRFSQERTLQIRSEMEIELFGVMQPTLEVLENTPVLHPAAQEENVEEVGGEESRNDEFTDALRAKFDLYRESYEAKSLQEMPQIPKLPTNKKAFDCVHEMNEILLTEFTDDMPLEDLLKKMKCAALSVCDVMQIKILPFRGGPRQQKEQQEHKKKKTPKWIQRIEAKIKWIRQDVGRIEAFLRDERLSWKVRKRLKRIAFSLQSSLYAPGIGRKLRNHAGFLKQKISAFGARIRRYKEAAMRREQDWQFTNNRRQFFRDLQNPEKKGSEEQDLPSQQEVTAFWSNIWSSEVKHNEDAEWLGSIENKASGISDMLDCSISVADVRRVIMRTQNWKAPGHDGLQNFWWKKFNASHSVLRAWFAKFVEDPNTIPDFMTRGVTYLLFKSGDPKEAKNYRPITCLPTVYKFFTAILAKKIQLHLDDNQVIAAEQNGCRKGAMGCKELLVVDAAVSSVAKKCKKSLSMCWIDYKKAFDSVPHSWLLKVLEVYKINPKVINVLRGCMSSWRTQLSVGKGAKAIRSEEIFIKRGIFQGDGLSPLWFILAMNPVSDLLKDLKIGFKLSNLLVSHQLYMDDLKMYASNENELKLMKAVVKEFSDDIRMEFGIDKCAEIHVKRGEVLGAAEIFQVHDDVEFPTVDEEEGYKYLGMHQLVHIQEQKMRSLVERKVLDRVKKICKSKLSGRNKIAAINSWAVPVATYGFGVINWSKSSLEAFDRKIRTTMTKFRLHHPRSSMQRLYIPRGEGGRGLLSLETMCSKQCEHLREYFVAHRPEFVEAVRSKGIKFGSLSLHLETADFPRPSLEDRREIWRGKELHGRFAKSLSSQNIDKKWSTEWLRTSGLFAESEGFVLGIQDQVINTRAYQRHVMRQNVSDRCRLCKTQNESIQHISGGCSVLAPKEYLERHNNVAKVVHQALAVDLGLQETEEPYYKCRPEQIMQKGRVRMLWDSLMATDRAVEANRPDICVIDQLKQEGLIVDIAVPLDDNIEKTIAEKKRKYQQLSVEMKDMYKLKKVSIVPVVISVNGLVTKDFVNLKNQLPLVDKHLRLMQKAAILGTANVVRKVLSL